MQPVRIGVVGWGRFGRLHALSLSGLADAELAGVVARRQESLSAMQAEIPGTPGWLDMQQAINESDADAWIVACTTASHVPITRLILESGKVALLEKPIADNLSDAESLQPLVADDSSNLMIGHIVLFNSEYLELLAEANRRGGVSYVNCVRHRPASIVRDFPGENPLHAAMVHDLYATQVLLERQEPTTFSAQYHRTSSGTVDLALAQLQWENGSVASFAASYLTPDGMPPRGFDRMEVFGPGWAARVEPNPRPLEVWDDERATWPYCLEIRTDVTGPTGMMAEEQRCFCRVVRGEQAVPMGATFSDALQVQRWMERLADAAESGAELDRTMN